MNRERISAGRETIQESQMGMLKTKNMISEMKNSLDRLSSKLITAKEKLNLKICTLRLTKLKHNAGGGRKEQSI